MNERLTRKEIKRDELANVVGRGVEYAEGHVRPILYTVGGVLLLLALGTGLYFYLGAQARKANEALSYAIKVSQAPIQATGAKPDDKTAPSFATEAARQARAKELFTEIHSGVGGAEAADVAGLYLARIAADEGKLDQARKLWQEFVDGNGDHVLAGEARLNLFSLDRKEGKGEELVTRLRGMLEESEPPLPKDVILHELAATQEQLGRPQEAVQSYQKIVDDYPQSPYRQDAQQKMSALDPTRSPVGIGMPGMAGFPPG